MAQYASPIVTPFETFWLRAHHTCLLPPTRNISFEDVVIGCVARGRATERQDHHLPLVQSIAEGSEELRLSLCRMVGRMLRTLMDRGTVGVLRPYLDDTILLLVSQCRDPYSTVTVEALSIITKLVLHPHLEQVRQLSNMGRYRARMALSYLLFTHFRANKKTPSMLIDTHRG